ncbi:MAG: hypothetical protein WCA39_15440 [Nitrososphaeraceae archaeon]
MHISSVKSAIHHLPPSRDSSSMKSMLSIEGKVAAGNKYIPSDITRLFLVCRNAL